MRQSVGMVLGALLWTSFAAASGGDASKDGAPSSEEQEQEREEEAPFQDPGGMYGEYESNQESSGTSWQPVSSPSEYRSFQRGEWVFLMQGFVNVGYIDTPKPRGDRSSWTTNLFVVRALRPTFEGTLGLRAAMSLEPVMGKEGYPLLVQTGQTADGINPLFDRQHPHDLFSELAITFTTPITDRDSVFVYFAAVGQPALGPPSFQYRFSGAYNPVAPITQQWLDASRVTYGVLTAGLVSTDRVKLEGSFFRGREPDENRWGIEAPDFDSYSLRVTVNPTEAWSLQASFAHLAEPLERRPFEDATIVTASATYNRKRKNGNWQTTLGFGRRKRDTSGSEGQNGFLVESSFEANARHTLFARFESTAKDDLFPADDPRTEAIFDVAKLDFGYLYHVPIPGAIGVGLGASGAVHFLPDALDDVYDGKQPGSFLIFARFDLR